MDRGDYRMIGEAGQFKSATDATVLNGALYTADEDGNFYRWDADTVAYEKIGDGGWKPRIFFASGDKLFTIEEETGAVFAIDPADGSYAKLAENTEWASCACAALALPKMTICDQHGTIGCLDVDSGEWKKLSTEEWGVSNMFNGQGCVHVLEPDGSLYKLELRIGMDKLVGNEGDWAGCTASDGGGGYLYFCVGGAIHWLDPETGDRGQIGESSSWNPTMMLVGDGGLFSFEADGTLYQISTT